MKEKKKRTRRVFKDFGYLECDAFAEYLHGMSMKGWHFREWRLGLVFEKGEPEDVCYCVEVFPKGSEMDTKPEEPAEEYAEYCQAAGWEFLDGQRRFCIFRKVAEDAVPIVTEGERFDNVRKAECSRLGSEVIAPLLITALFWFRAMGREFEDWMFSNLYLALLLTVTIMTFMRLIQCIAVIVWGVFGKRKRISGKKIIYGRKYWEAVWNGIYVLFLVGVFLLLVAEGGVEECVIVGTVFLMVSGFSWGIAYFRPSRAGNWGSQIAGGFAFVFLLTLFIGVWVVSVPEEKGREEALAQLPMVQADYREITGEPVSADYQYTESILGSRLRGMVEYGENRSEDNEGETDRLTYEVYRSSHPWILVEVWRRETDSQALPLAQIWTSLQFSALIATTAGKNAASEIFLISFLPSISVTSRSYPLPPVSHPALSAP